MRASILIAAAACAASTPSEAQVLSRTETLLEVQSIGESEARPDRATISGGVTTNASTTAEAVAANSVAMTEVIAALVRAGVPEEDIRTASVNLAPQYARREPGDYSTPRIVGYAAANSVIITVRDISKVGRFLGAMFEAGATNVNGPNFSIDNDEPVIAAARSDAIEKAQAEAEVYAAGFGMRVSRIIRISERGRATYYVSADNASPPPPPPPPPPPAPGLYQDVPVSVGRMSQNVTLWVDFALVPR